MIFALAISASAEETNAQISLNSTKAMVGETADITVSINNNPGIGALGLIVKYNPDVLSIGGSASNPNECIVNGSVLGNATGEADAQNPILLVNTYTTPGEIYIGLISSSNISENGELLTLRFTVKSNADIADTDLTLTVEDFSDTNAEFYTGYTVENGRITITENTDPMIFGDIDGNGSVTSSDALKALQYSVGKITLTERQIILANVNNIDGVTTADALLILQRSVGKISSFPIEMQ